MAQITKSSLEKLNKSELVELALEQNAQLVEATEINAELQNELAASQEETANAKSGIITITSGKEKFQVNIPAFNFNGRKCTAADLKDDKDLVKAVLGLKGQQILTPLKD